MKYQNLLVMDLCGVDPVHQYTAYNRIFRISRLCIRQAFAGCVFFLAKLLS